MSEGNSKSFDKTFRDVLSLNSTISLIKSEQPASGGDGNKTTAEDKISGLVPIFKLDDLVELDDNSFGKIVLNDDIVIFNGLVYVKSVEIGFQSRVSELINQYTNQMKKMIGNKRALIEAYERIPIVDLVSLIGKNIVLTVSDHGTLVAIRHLSEVKVVFRDRTWDFPPLTIKVPIYDGVPSDVHVKSMTDENYIHPFVFYHDGRKDAFGQKLCMGDFNPNSKSVRFNDNKRWDELNLAQKLLILIPQAVQILTTGYNPGVSPANGHLTDAKYNRYLTKKGGKN